MPADIAQSGGAKQRIANRVRQRVTVGVPDGALREGDFHPPQDQVAA